MEDRNKKYTELFEEMLNVMGFEIEKGINNQGKIGYNILDTQRDTYLNGYDDDITSYCFKNSTDIIDRLEIYIDDYYFTDLEEAFEKYNIESDKIPDTAEEWIELRNNIQNSNNEKEKKFIKIYAHEFDVMELLCTEGTDKLIDLDFITQNPVNFSNTINENNIELGQGNEANVIYAFPFMDDESYAELELRSGMLQDVGMSAEELLNNTDATVSLCVKITKHTVTATATLESETLNDKNYKTYDVPLLKIEKDTIRHSIDDAFKNWRRRQKEAMKKGSQFTKI